jgi:hypothetical protein
MPEPRKATPAAQAGDTSQQQNGNRWLTPNSGLAMFVAPIGIWVETPAIFSSVFVPLHIS